MEDVPPQMRLLPRAIDFRAQQTPDRLYAFLPKGPNVEDGFSKFTYSGLSKAVDAMAWWLDKVLDAESRVVPYIGANDIRYGLLVFAAIKTGRVAMVPLMYNTPEGQVKLLQQLGCNVVVASAGCERYWSSSLEAMDGLRLVTMPGPEIFLEEPHKPYPFQKSWDEGRDDAMVLMQTSGTTGNPKPLRWSHGLIQDFIERLTLSKNRSLDDRLGTEASMHSAWTPNLLPLSWGMGLFHLIAFPLVFENIVTVLPSSVPHPVPAEFVHKLIQYGPMGPTNGAMFVPDVLKDLVRNPAYLESLKKYDWVGFAGAPLAHSIGDVLTKTRIRVQSIMGQMDSGGYPTLISSLDDWKYARFEEIQGFHLQSFSQDTWELCVRRQPGDQRPAFLLNPEIDVYHTRDLWKKVPGLEGYWATAGRVDDFVKLASLTKFNAIVIESVLEQDPGIEKALVGGDGRNWPFVLLEPSQQLRETCGGQVELMIESVWPQLQMANTSIHADARLGKDLLLFTAAESPIQRTAKGTSQRQATFAIYAKDIEALYS
ncbi:hypothetical protein PRZ48_004425 [Zasmidium cellare]|uniref:AMP-dependent synthetase/ligase domain-containing protein n=1 Tax=Zasmidium cellare TaxID=395010 RepID=A0ABR0EPS0_ZASCE|nr:hypothetical protein PRZ48_004425 [Zasmidium cellare]